MKSLYLLALACIPAVAAFAQEAETDRESIIDQCGCHSIDFDYVETFVYRDNYERYSPYHAHASAEYVFVDEQTEDRIVIQHILIVNDTFIVKHWRQDWIYENTDVHEFAGNNSWTYRQLDENETSGQWTQKVYQVDDSPRYQGSATWVHVDGKSYWENTTNAPLPRREYTKRRDYQIMVRTNRHEITEAGFDHIQQNVKTEITADGYSPIVSEAGLNRYTETDDNKCEVARVWWEQNKTFWRAVRNAWDVVLAPHNDITIAEMANDQMLWQALHELAEETAGDDEEEIMEEAIEVLNNFVTATPSVNTAD